VPRHLVEQTPAQIVLFKQVRKRHTVVSFYLLLRSRHGLALTAIRDSEPA
jgi:ABC-type branched-subunit amino acid transport system permease subunit